MLDAPADAIANTQRAAREQAKTYTVGSYLAERLSQIGLKHHFVVAGDYNLVLLDQLLSNKDLEQVYCSNELNCGYSAEGYARAHGAAAAVVTFSVGALSAFNAIGGAYAENLPVILISGAPNSNDRGSEHLLHHTLGTHDNSYQLEMAKKITCAAVSITSATDAPALIDHAIRTALREKKPAYIEIACNISSVPCAAPGPISGVVAEEPSDPETLNAAVEAAVAFLRKKQKPVMLIGSKLRAAGAEKEAVALAEALGCSVAVMAAAKSFFPEDHPQYAGIYWGEISTPGAREIVDWSDAVVCIGALFNDYSTVGWTAMPTGAGVVTADMNRVHFEGHDFSRIHLRDFLAALARKVEKRDATMVQYGRIRSARAPEKPAQPDAKLMRAEIVRQIRPLVTSNTTVIAETGDSWFNGLQLELPRGARFEIEMMWGSIGWSAPATFGYAVGASGRRIIALIGDGSFQLTAQEVAQMIRRNLRPIIFLINNHGYTIEVEIHDGPVQQRQELGLRRTDPSLQRRRRPRPRTARHHWRRTRGSDQGRARQQGGSDADRVRHPPRRLLSGSHFIWPSGLDRKRSSAAPGVTPRCADGPTAQRISSSPRN